MAISAYTANDQKPQAEQYIGLSLKWDSGVMLSCPCCLVIDAEGGNLYLAGIFTSMTPVKKYQDDDFKLDKQITVALVRRVETKQNSPTMWDKFLVDRLKEYNGQIVNVSFMLGTPYEPILKQGLIDDPHGISEPYFSVAPSNTSGEFKDKLEEIKSILLKSASKGGNRGSYRAISDSEKLQQRLTFLKENKVDIGLEIAETVGMIVSAQKFQTDICVSLSDDEKDAKVFEITPEYVQNLTRDLLISLLQ